MLENGTQHTTSRDQPDEYDGDAFESTVLNLDPDTVFPRTQLVKGAPEMTIAELRADRRRERRAATSRATASCFTIQQKFSLPVACLVLALIGLALGASNRKDGKLASFALGIGVDLRLLHPAVLGARRRRSAGGCPPSFAPWLANIVLGAAGVALVVWRAGSADQPIRFSVPALLAPAATPQPASPGGATRAPARRAAS